MNSLPLLCHPSKILFLDDERSFLEHLDVGLDGDAGEIELFQKPDLALDWIEMNGVVGLGEGEGVELIEDEPEEKLVSIQVQILREKERDPSRLEKGAVVFVDYQMEAIDGIAWCQEVTNPFVEKILLTGVADEHVGIEALNNRWIHQYVRKQDLYVLDKVKSAARRGRLNCFSRLSQSMYSAITQDPDDTALSDPAFHSMFYKLLEKEGIIEHYLIDGMGSFLMIDKMGKRRCLFVQTKAKAESNLQFLDGWIKDDQIKNDLENGRKIICCPSSKSFVSPNGADYNSYLFSANILKGRQTYYWAITPELR